MLSTNWANFFFFNYYSYNQGYDSIDGWKKISWCRWIYSIELIESMEGVDYEVNVQWYKYPPFVRVVWRKFHDTKKKCFIIESNSESFFREIIILCRLRVFQNECVICRSSIIIRGWLWIIIYIYISMRLNGYKGKGIVKWLFLWFRLFSLAYFIFWHVYMLPF